MWSLIFSLRRFLRFPLLIKSHFSNLEGNSKLVWKPDGSRIEGKIQRSTDGREKAFGSSHQDVRQVEGWRKNSSVTKNPSLVLKRGQNDCISNRKSFNLLLFSGQNLNQIKFNWPKVKHQNIYYIIGFKRLLKILRWLQPWMKPGGRGSAWEAPGWKLRTLWTRTKPRPPKI